MPITLFFYYLPALRGFQLGVLLLAGCFFYAYSRLEFLLVLALSAVMNGVFSYLTQRSATQRGRRFWALSGVVLNLCLLGFFKYAGLFYRTFFPPSSLGDWLLSLPLPIGVSFYTFQGISLLVDVMRDPSGLSEGTRDFWPHMLKSVFFISYFPQSIAGPILKYHPFLPQIGEKRFRDIPLGLAFRALTVGFFLKSAVADNLHNYTFWMDSPAFLDSNALVLLVMMMGYSVQIFADFAGYSLIAIGISALFGYNLPQNFNFPYISQSFREFWTRWHISLSAWLKEYLYIPLGGNRKGKVRTYVNLLIVMLLGGLWHGAGWNYMAWGGVHGLLLAAGRFLAGTRPGRAWTRLSERHGLLRGLRILLVLLMVSWAWLFFKLPSFSQAMLYTRAMTSNWGNWNLSGHRSILIYCFLYSLPILCYHLLYLFRIPSRAGRWWRALEPVIYAVMLFLILTNRGTSDAFIYFQF